MCKKKTHQLPHANSLYKWFFFGRFRRWFIGWSIFFALFQIHGLYGVVTLNYFRKKKTATTKTNCLYMMKRPKTLYFLERVLLLNNAKHSNDPKKETCRGVVQTIFLNTTNVFVPGKTNFIIQKFIISKQPQQQHSNN